MYNDGLQTTSSPSGLTPRMAANARLVPRISRGHFFLAVPLQDYSQSSWFIIADISFFEYNEITVFLFSGPGRAKWTTVNLNSITI